VGAHQASAAANQEIEEGDQGEIRGHVIDAQIKRTMAGRLQGESGRAGLQVALTGIEDPSEEHKMQVYRAGALLPGEGGTHADRQRALILPPLLRAKVVSAWWDYKTQS
jgi:hypothetical protein